jgi:hypothetical protein
MRDHEIRDHGGLLITVPDFASPDIELAAYCDGFAVRGNIETLELDARKRNFLQEASWTVLAYWRRTILKNPPACARRLLRSTGSGVRRQNLSIVVRNPLRPANLGSLQKFQHFLFGNTNQLIDFTDVFPIYKKSQPS